MMPEAWASSRSIARCVLPVFVGPRTALTRAANPDMRKMFGGRRADCKRFRVLLMVRSSAGCDARRMPTVLRVDGFRFYFYGLEGDEPPHVHIEYGDRLQQFSFWPDDVAQPSWPGLTRPS